MRTLFVIVTSMMSLVSSAQIVEGDESKKQSDMVTIADIMREEQAVTQNEFVRNHFEKVWERRTYLNISTVSGELTPKDQMPTGLGNALVPNFKNEWGVALSMGSCHRLHKTPIANMVQLYIDWTPMDLNVNYFKEEGNGIGIYDSSIKHDNQLFYIPWNLEKYEANYGMSLGPSVTVAPFTSLNSAGLHYFKLNFYYHIGYHASILMLQNKNPEKADANKNHTKDTYSQMDGNHFIWGHGLTQSFGFNVSWKFIGVGYEKRNASLEYTPFDDKFGKDKNNFKTSQNRVYLQFRF